MTHHIWFLVVVFTGHPHEGPISLGQFATRAECMADAPGRMAGFQYIGSHGRYLCMYHNQPDKELARAPVATF